MSSSTPRSIMSDEGEPFLTENTSEPPTGRLTNDPEPHARDPQSKRKNNKDGSTKRSERKEKKPDGPVYEHHDLDRAILRNRWINPVQENGEVLISERHFGRMLKKLCDSVPTRYGDSTQPPTIYMVPEELGNFYYCPRGEYEPVAVCIGSSNSKISRSARYQYTRCAPYRYTSSLLQLQEYKWWCARQLISRYSGLLEPARTLVLLYSCFESMKRLQPQILASYSSGSLLALSDRNEDELAEMMLLDGCFILHRLLKYARRAEKEATGGDLFDDDDDDWTQVYGRCWVWQLVTRDLLLLENQIPFMVIRELFKKLKTGNEPEDILVTGSRRLFRSLRPQMLHHSPIACADVHHLLHLFYLSVGFPPSDSQLSQQQQADQELLSELPQWIPCAKELEEAGVRFRKRKNGTSFLDIKFARGVLEIPQLQLSDSSESLFRNLIAFEQTYPDTRRDISTYTVFMDYLITSQEDMRILDMHGILVNHLSSVKVGWRFFSAISTQVHWPADNYLVDVMGEVNKYRDSRRHKWREALVRTHFSNPWVAISLLAALLLLSMTVLQTFFTVYAYFKPPK